MRPFWKGSDDGKPFDGDISVNKASNERLAENLLKDYDSESNDSLTSQPQPCQEKQAERLFIKGKGSPWKGERG